MKNYDVFISYRREDAVAARSLHERLKSDGYKVFLDVAAITNCEFDKRIQNAIETCQDFIIILSKTTLNFSKTQKDWVKEELSLAIKLGKNIIPIFLPSFKAFPKDLPKDLESIETINGINYNHEYFQSYYSKLKDDYMLSKGKSHRMHLWGVTLLAFVAISTLLAVLWPHKLIKQDVSISFFGADSSKNVALERETFRDTLHFVKVTGGEFYMGIHRTPQEGRVDESPEHRVILETFWMSDVELTEGAWHLFTDDPNHTGGGPTYPRYGLNYDICQKFIEELNDRTEKERPQGLVFRLPTEAEWEYAARGGINHDSYLYSGSDTLALVTNCANPHEMEDKIDKKLGVVKSKMPNSLGIFDLSGNLCEWCYDWYDKTYYRQCGERIENPTGPNSGETRVVRGGAYNMKDSHCDVYNRSALKPTKAQDGEYQRCGLRLVLGKPIGT